MNTHIIIDGVLHEIKKTMATRDSYTLGMQATAEDHKVRVVFVPKNWWQDQDSIRYIDYAGTTYGKVKQFGGCDVQDTTIQDEG